MARKRSSELIETEVAFRIKDPKSFPLLLEKLWTAGGLIDMDGVMATRVVEEIKGAVHVFSARTRGDEKERLRLSIGRHGLIAKLDQKRLNGRMKFERNIESSRRKKDVVRLMNRIQPMISLLCKERASLTYKFISPAGSKKKRGRERYFTLSIDRIAAIPVDSNPATKCFAFFDLDIEGDGLGSELQFATSSYFRKELRPLLKPLERSTAKWRLAKRASGEAAKNHKYDSYEEVVEFFQSCLGKFSEMFPGGHRLAGPGKTQ